MSVPNSYPELPEIAYKRTTVNMLDVIRHANSYKVYPLEVRRAAYCLFRNESANGEKGVNGNFAGIQADCGRWSGLKNAIATCVRVDSGRKARRFICFDEKTGYKDTFDFLCLKVRERGMFIGAPDVPNTTALTAAYLKKWVGRTMCVPNDAELHSWNSLYNDAKRYII